MLNRLGVASVTDLSPFNPACAAGHALTYVTLDVFSHGKAPICNRCDLFFRLGPAPLLATSARRTSCLKYQSRMGWLNTCFAMDSLSATAVLTVSRAAATLSAICHHQRGSAR